MQFVVIGLDGIDADAPARRQTVRQDHIAMGEKLLASRNLKIHRSNTRDSWQYSHTQEWFEESWA